MYKKCLFDQVFRICVKVCEYFELFNGHRGFTYKIRKSFKIGDRNNFLYITLRHIRAGA